MSARHLTPGEIRTVRRIKGLTQRQAAEQIGVHPVTWAKWEAGKHIPTGMCAVGLERWAKGLPPWDGRTTEG